MTVVNRGARGLPAVMGLTPAHQLGIPFPYRRARGRDAPPWCRDQPPGPMQCASFYVSVCNRVLDAIRRGGRGNMDLHQDRTLRFLGRTTRAIFAGYSWPQYSIHRGQFADDAADELRLAAGRLRGHSTGVVRYETGPQSAALILSDGTKVRERSGHRADGNPLGYSARRCCRTRVNLILERRESCGACQRAAAFFSGGCDDPCGAHGHSAFRGLSDFGYRFLKRVWPI